MPLQSRFRVRFIEGRGPRGRADLLMRTWRRALARSKRDLGRLLKRHVQNEIRAVTTRRTGDLLRVRVRGFTDHNPYSIRLVPDFPRTVYETAPGKGRRGASKRGQYGFVLNSDRDRRFIQKAVRAFGHDRQVPLIIRKHYLYIIQQERNR